MGSGGATEISAAVDLKVQGTALCGLSHMRRAAQNREAFPTSIGKMVPLGHMEPKSWV